jgi:hypothetical protein
MKTLEQKARYIIAKLPSNKIFFDTEFIDDKNGLILLSIGLVKEDGSTYYAEVLEADRSLANDWVKANVLPLMKGPIKPKYQIAKEIEQFAGYKPEFWAYFAAYDWVLLCRLYDGLLSLPKSWPHYPVDLLMIKKSDSVFPEQKTIKHHALNDAIWNKEVYEALVCQRSV